MTSRRQGTVATNPIATRTWLQLSQGRLVQQGDEISSSARRGRLRFLALRTGPQGNQWLDVVAIGRGSGIMSIPVDSITVVHRTRKSRAG